MRFGGGSEDADAYRDLPFLRLLSGSASPVSSSWFRFRFVLVPDAYRDLLFLRLLSGACLSQKVEKATLNLTFSRRVSRAEYGPEGRAGIRAVGFGLRVTNILRG